MIRRIFQKIIAFLFCIIVFQSCTLVSQAIFVKNDFEKLCQEIGAIVKAKYIDGIDTGSFDYELCFYVTEVYAGDIRKGKQSFSYIVRDAIEMGRGKAELDENAVDYKAGKEYLLILNTKNEIPQLLGLYQYIPFGNLEEGRMYPNESLQDYIGDLFDISLGEEAFVNFLIQQSSIEKNQQSKIDLQIVLQIVVFASIIIALCVVIYYRKKCDESAKIKKD